MPWHPYTKILLLLCFIGLIAFLTTAMGLGSDYWLIYRLSANATADTNSTNVRLARAGVWRVCYRPEALPDDGKPCHNINYLSEVENRDPLYQYIYPVYGKDLLLGFLALVCIGVALIFVAEVLAMICLKKRSKAMYIGTAVIFILAGIVGSAGLIIFSLRGAQLLYDWPNSQLGESPYDMISFGWSFAITWLGAALALCNSTGYMWLARRHLDAMM
ncbi:uncharacterized protein LOC110973653 [Acanthaster planci]|uniref:Uncharacterized protein LOC110973653 n=1 Tax=Acanthaster planci TaxID=133434 RepID=A0A8B7XHR0_ACAPL|nr:uncharacterized protein LOC110973653 [Acanthaster planci]